MPLVCEMQIGLIEGARYYVNGLAVSEADYRRAKQHLTKKKQAKQYG